MTALAFIVLMYALVAVYGFYALFLVYVTLRVAQKNGKLAASPVIVKLLAYSYLALALVIDVLFNLTLGALFFLQSPLGYGWTFTARCSRNRYIEGWRRERAIWVCDGWLNPFEAGHC